MQSESDTEVAVSLRPAGYQPTDWQVRTRCCELLARPATDCNSEDASGTCYPTGLTWSAAAEACANDGRRLCSAAELSACCGTGCMGDNYLTWTEDVCTSPSPPPPPPSPHAPVCSYYIMESNANTEACPASDRITTEGACESYDQWLRDGNNFASSGLTGTLQGFRKSPLGSSALAGGCNVLKTSSPQVWFDPALSQTLATAGGNYYAVCGGCFPRGRLRRIAHGSFHFCGTVLRSP